MTSRVLRRPPGGRCRLAVGGTALTMVAATLGSCSGPSAVSGSPGSSPAPLPTPLATSIITSEGTWVSLPMGHLDQPSNTFWQLLHQPVGGTKWSNQVGATAVATNGGLVLASPGGQGLVAGIRPFGNLTFSPLIATSDAGKTWSDGLVDAGLASRPDAVAAGSAGQAVALIADHHQTTALVSSAGLSSWATLVTQARLQATAAGRACGLASITAAGYFGGSPVIGGLCDRPGVVGLFAETGGGWALLQPSPELPTSSTGVEVLAIRSVGSRLAVLIGLSINHAARVVAAWTAGPGQPWTISSDLPLGASVTVSSYGPVAADGFFVLTSGPSGAENLSVIAGDAQPWTQPASPPAGTATIAAATSQEIQAFQVRDTVLTIWTLAPGAVTWQRGQTLNVQIEFGSSG